MESSDKDIKMSYRYLGNTGLKVSVLAFGTMLMEFTEENNQKWIECAKAAYKAGINYFDSAEIYGFGQGDKNLGKAIKEFGCDRKDLVISVKIFHGGIGPNHFGMSRKHIIEGTLKSLKNMGLEYCDLVFSHRPSFKINLEETCRAFNWLIKKGYAKYWCTSTWPSEMVAEAIKICEDLGLSPPIAEQCEYSALQRSPVEVEYRRLFERFGYGTTVWSPLCGGLLTGKYNDGNIESGSRFENWFAKDLLWEKFMGDHIKDKTLKSLKGMKEFAEELGCTQAQLALAWVLVSKDVSTCITGASRPEQIESNVKALKVAAEWNEEKEKKMQEILDNEPTPRLDWEKFQPDQPRRGTVVSYDFKLGEVQKKTRVLKY